ncbi:ABC transporter ATP-binding protein [Bacillus altitudinis]|uniref:ABC transporter ATP-binding protein n=1 Tax=Bacillus altitudinis TaxID=293387 RepID=UPI000706E212|nr:ABC transporter ATP-binding protein [Bacillus altitudinis]ALM27297.1 heme ABC transporter ATP-binding protein [Bacillus altitudinis]ALM43838.1 heme ABC transporter ATP-binding protein [Bacillus altitudinis]ANY95310.1 heme ABC transporter ATP-binding protein [Bacillus altitudinis]
MKKPMIQFEHFGFKYRSQAEPTLKDINLTIYEGEKVLIAGPSGSGKSTLAHCINGLVPASYKGSMEGSLHIGGKNAKKENIFSLSQLVGTVLQDPDGQFIGLTVGEDIAFTLENDQVTREEMKTRVEKAAKLTEVDGKLASSVHELSGGQKQRVAIAGVLVNDVDILLFDEPLASLDPATGKEVIDLIDRLQKETKKTVVMVEHRLEDVLFRHVDRIIVVNDGTIAADMTPDELLASNVLEAAYLREPLYVRAMKYAGIPIAAGDQIANLQHLTLNDEAKEKIEQWMEASEPSVEQNEASDLLEVRELSFDYPTRPNTLNNISFTVKKGEMISIAGANGAGKTTLSKVLCAFEKPTKGTILLNGDDITGDTIKQRSERIGVVMQNPNQMISKQMIFDEVALGLVLRGVKEDDIKERVERVLKVCGLYPFRNWPISALSFGQKKRVTIASILVLEPEIIILDEPTAGQDFRHYTEMMTFLEQLNQQGVTILMITHDMHLMLEYTTRTIVISDGEKIADDTPAKVLTDQLLVQKASLKETSLYELALKADWPNPNELVDRFIEVDRKERMTWL